MSITRRRASRALAALLVALGLPAAAQAALELSLPAGARLAAERATDPDSYALPAGPWTGKKVPAIATEGAVTRQAWQVPGQSLTLLQIMGPLRGQLREAGFEIVLDCAAAECGGFDFRFGTEVLPAPEMHVDVTRFRFLSAFRVREAEGAADYVSVLVSRGAGAGFVQIVHVDTGGGGTLRVADDAASLPLSPDTPLLQRLVQQGHTVLADLEFASGSSQLEDGSYASLTALAEWLNADARRVVALVGHTDAVGALDTNIALSRDRARSVRARLVDRHAVPEAQLQAEGMGYLAPVASNLTPEGRTANRRVEAVLIAAE